MPETPKKGETTKSSSSAIPPKKDVIHIDDDAITRDDTLRADMDSGPGMGQAKEENKKMAEAPSKDVVPQSGQLKLTPANFPSFFPNIHRASFDQRYEAISKMMEDV
jgi:hypothetical protein